jgi:cytochrome c556
MKLLLLLVAANVLTTALPAQAQFQKPEDAVKYRQGAFFVMGQHFGRLGAMVNGRVPFDARTATDNADLVADLARLPWPAFMAGTDKGGTKAKAEVWSEAGRFKEGADKLQADLLKLAAAAKSGNPEALKAAFGAAATGCKACHDNFRAQ